MSDINEMNVGLRWYVAHTYSGYENKVKHIGAKPSYDLNEALIL